MYVTNIFANSGILEFFLFFCMPKRKVTKEKGSTNTAPLPAANRLAAAHARVDRPDRYRDSCTPTLQFHNVVIVLINQF